MRAPDRAEPSPTGGQTPGAELERAVTELGEAAARLRREDLEPDEAADLVERCADLAIEAGAALEREARAARAEPAPGQETLL